MDEAKLIKRIKSGDMDAFSQLVSIYEKKAINYAYRMLNDTSEAEDAAQEAFLKVFDKIESFREKAAFSTWFYTILNNVCLDFLRKRSRTADTVSINQTSNEDDEYELQLEDSAPGPYEQLQKNEAQRLLQQAISQLSDEHRTIIIMRDINGFDYEEIAKITGVSLGTVKSRLSRARLALRNILKENRELFT